MGRLAQAQHAALQRHARRALPDDARAKRTHAQHGMPPAAQSLAARSGLAQRCAPWLDEVAPAATRNLRPPRRPAGDGRSPDEARWKPWPTAFCDTEFYGEQADKLLFVAAALQVYWTRLAVQPAGAGRTASARCARRLPVLRQRCPWAA